MYQILKQKNLVYLAVYKCASTYYTGVLAQNNWKNIKPSDIDWEKDTVFGFIQDPLERYIKGLAEDVHNNLTQWTIDNLPLFKDGVILTEHTWPVQLIIGEHADQVHWLRLTSNVQKNNLLLEKFLLEYNEKVVLYPADMHTSNLEKLEIYNAIKERLEENQFLFHLVSIDKKYFNHSRTA